jgi:septal ring factor EnvC (AmiA/AmiB activator)
MEAPTENIFEPSNNINNIPKLETMKNFKNPLALLLVFTILFVSCDNKKQKELARQKNYEIGILQSKLMDYQSYRNLLDSELINQQAKLTDHSRSKFQLESKLADYENRVMAYLMDHKMAVACIVGGLGGATVSFDTTNEFSREVKNVAGAVTAISAIYAILNYSEVSEVADVLVQADSHVKNIKKEIGKVDALIKNTKYALGDKERKLIALKKNMVATRTRIEQLNI